MSVPSAVATSSQDASPETLKPEQVVLLLRDDLQRLAGLVAQNRSVTLADGSGKLTVPYAGMANVSMISDTLTVANAGNYQTFQLTVNGGVVVNQSITTAAAVIPAYQGGRSLGTVSVAKGDVISVKITNTGAPAPALTLTNISLIADLTRS